MAEVFDIITGVIGIVGPFVTQIEQFVQRCEAIVDNPTAVKQLASDCADVHSRILQLQQDLDPDGKQRASYSLEVFCSAFEDVKTYLQSAKRDLDKLESKFPPAPTRRGELFHKATSKCRNFVLANNFARNIGNISKKINNAKQSLNSLKIMLEIYVSVKEPQAAVRQGASPSAEEPTDKFQPQFLVPAMLPNIVLDFCPHNEDDKPITMEGELKQTLMCLDTNQSDPVAVAVAVGAAGMGGVGKTSALIGLGWEKDLRDRFSEGGVYFVSVGKDASVGDIIKKLGHIVRRTGGIRCAKRVLESKSLPEAVEEVNQWFQGRCSLFLFDDFWETEESKVGYLPHVKQLLSSCTRSRMVVSTRSDEIALEGGKPVKFEARKPNGEQSRSILLKYAGVSTSETAEMPKASKAALETVLKKCGGVPLTLGVAGRAIRQMTPSCSGNRAKAMFVYARDVEAEISRVGNREIGMYPSFEATIRTSLCVADRWSEEYELRRRTGEQIRCSQLFTALCVLRRQTRVPREMVKRLWRVTDERVVHDVVRKFVDLNLVSERRSSDGGFTIGAHDLILEYCQEAAGPDAQRYHANLLNEYLANDGEMARQCNVEGNDDSELTQPAGTFCRSWWDFGNDCYLSEHICRHLAQGGCVSELVSLLSDFRWTEVRVRSGDLLRWHEDFKCAFSALCNSEDTVEMRQEAQEGLKTIRDAAHDGWGLTANNVAELSFQMQSRLCEAGRRSWVGGKYMKSIERYAKKPWLRCDEGCWPKPGSSQSSVISLTDGVRSLKLAKHGRLGVVACGKAILIVNMETRCIISSLPHENEVTDVEVSWDGRRIVSRSGDGTVCIWDGTSGEAVGEPLRGHERWVTCVAVSGDGKRVVSGSGDAVYIWDGTNGEAIGEPLRGGSFVSRVAISGDGKRIVSRLIDGRVCIWDGTSGKAVGQPLRGHEEQGCCVAVSGDGNRIVSGLDGGTVCIWDGTSGEVMGELLRRHEVPVGHVAVSWDGKQIVSGSYDGGVYIWDGTSAKALGEPLHRHEETLSCVAINGDGKRIVSGSRDGTVRVWDGTSGKVVGELLRAHEKEVSCVAVSGDGKRIVSGSGDGTIRIWDGTSREATSERLRRRKERVLFVGVSGDRKRIVSGSAEGRVCIWDGRSGEAVCGPLHGHEERVSCVAISGDGKRIVSGSRDGKIRIWDGTSGEAVGKPLRGPRSWVNCLAVSGDGKRIVSGSCDGKIRIWDGTSGEVVGEPLRGHEDWVTGVAVSRDGKRIVSRSIDGTVRIWDGTSGEAVGEPLPRHETSVECVAISGDGKRIVSGSFDRRVFIWDGTNGEAVGEPLHGHERPVKYVAVSGDGKRIVSGSSEGTLFIWDASGVSFDVTVRLKFRNIVQMGEVIRAETDMGYVNYWRRDEKDGLVEIDRTVWQQPGGGASSACVLATKWEVHVCGRQVLVRNSENDDAAVVATLPFEAIYDNWGSRDFQVSQDGVDGCVAVCRFEVWFRNNSILSFSLIV